MRPLYYTIGQVSMMAELPQSVLRYWETVFNNLNPVKSDGGNRQYSELDVKTINIIKDLLYNQGYTIKGAIHKFKQEENIMPLKNKLKEYPDLKKKIIIEIKKIIELLES